MQNGMLCGLTDAKPAFEDECASYDEDSSASSVSDSYNEEESVAEALSDNAEKLPGSTWFRIIGLLSLLNVVLSMLDVAFIFGLGLTQIAQVGIEYYLIDGLQGWATILGLPILMIYTWWMAAKAGSKLAYVIGILVYLFDAYVSYWLWDVTGDSAVIIDLVIHGALLVYFIYHFASYLGKSKGQAAESDEPAKPFNISMLIYLAVAVAVAVIACTTFTSFKLVFEILVSLQ
jgi:hypothetical protein